MNFSPKLLIFGKSGGGGSYTQTHNHCWDRPSTAIFGGGREWVVGLGKGVIMTKN